MLKNELEYFIENQEDFLKNYQGKFLVIKNQDVLGVFDSALTAYLETSKTHDLVLL